MSCKGCVNPPCEVSQEAKRECCYEDKKGKKK